MHAFYGETGGLGPAAVGFPSRRGLPKVTTYLATRVFLLHLNSGTSQTKQVCRARAGNRVYTESCVASGGEKGEPIRRAGLTILLSLKGKVLKL